MARIVSGAQREPSGLKEFAFTHDLFAQRRRDQDKRQQQAFENQLGMMKLMEVLQAERVKGQQLLNQNAQMGDAQAIQELSLRARMDPKQLRTKEAVDLLSGIKDPKARALALPAIGKLLDEEERQEKFKAADQMLQQASESTDRFQPEQIQGWAQRLQAKRNSGESPDDVMSEIMQVHQKVGEEITNANENQEALAQADQVVQSLPRGSFERRQAEIAFNAAASDQAALKRPGFGRTTLQAVQTAALGPREGFDERQKAAEEAKAAEKLAADEKFRAQPAPGLPGMSIGRMQEEMSGSPIMETVGRAAGVSGLGGSRIPEYTGGSRATTKGLKAGTIKPGSKARPKPDVKTAAKQAVQRSMGPRQQIEYFKSIGLDLQDPAVIEEVEAALQEARSAASGPEK